MPYEQITARLDKRIRAHQTELADLEPRIEEKKAAAAAAAAAMDAAARDCDADAYRKAKREAAYHSEALEMMQRRRAELLQPAITEAEYRGMTGAVLDDMEGELASVMDWAVETADLAAQYLGDLAARRGQALKILTRLAEMSGRPRESREELRSVGSGFDYAGACIWLQEIYNHYQYSKATGHPARDPLADNKRNQLWERNINGGVAKYER